MTFLDIKQRVCDTEEDMKAYFNVTSMLEDMAMADITKEFDCLPPCQYQSFDPIETSYQFDVLKEHPYATQNFNSDRYTSTDIFNS